MLTIRSSDIDLYPGSQEERLPGFSAQFPHICSHVLLPDGPAGACTWHWHKSMELFYVEKGALVYHTPGGQRLFRAGSGGMVNSNVLHRTQSLKNGTALRLHLFEAELLAGVPGGTVQQRYITPLVQRPGLELLALSPEVPGQAAALDLLRQSLYLDEDAFGYELRLQALLSEVWLAFVQQLPQLAVALCRHGAGIDHDHACLPGGGRFAVFSGFKAGLGKLPPHGLRLVLIDLATERIKPSPHACSPCAGAVSRAAAVSSAVSIMPVKEV